MSQSGLVVLENDLLSAQPSRIIRPRRRSITLHGPPGLVVNVAEFLPIIRIRAISNGYIPIPSPPGRQSEPRKTAGDAMAQRRGLGRELIEREVLAVPGTISAPDGEEDVC